MFQSDLPMLKVFSLTANEVGFWGFQERYLVLVNLASLNGENGVRSRRHRRPRHDANRLTGFDGEGFVRTRGRLHANDGEGKRIGRIRIKAAGKTVHG